MSWWTSQEIHPKTKSKFVVVFGSSFYLPNIKSINKPKVEFDTKEYRLLNHKFNYPGNGTWQPITMKFVDMNGMGRQKDHFDTGAFLWQIMNNTGYTYPYVENSQFRDPHFREVSSKAAEYGNGHHISTKIKLGENSTFRSITTPEKASTIANSFGLGLENFADFDGSSVSKQTVSIYQLAPFTGNEPENRIIGGEGFTPKGAIITECWHLVNPIVKTVGWGDLDYSSDELVEYELGVVYDWAIMDRTQIGKPFAVSAIPYQEFMKTLFVDNPEAITQRKLDIAGIGKADRSLRNDRRFQSEPGALDLNGDGRISTAEKNAAKDPNFDRVLDRNIEDLRRKNLGEIQKKLQSKQEQIEKEIDKEVDRNLETMSQTAASDSTPIGDTSSPPRTGNTVPMPDDGRPQFDPIEIDRDVPAATAEKLRKLNEREANREADIRQKAEDEIKRRRVAGQTNPSHGPDRKRKNNIPGKK